MIYMDNAASTRMLPEVVEAMIPYMRERMGNPSSIHREGRLARKSIERARAEVASLINAHPSEVLFTSGGTESNNTALYGIARRNPGCRIITTAIEHDSVLEPCSRLEEDHHNVVYLAPDGAGMINPADIKSALAEPAGLASVMTANNEVGTIQPIYEIARICRERGVPLHTDAVQAAGKIPLDVHQTGVDLASISSHKIGGPKGVGALYIRRGTTLDPVILGGGQESGLRSGTENVAGIVGFGEACRLARTRMDGNCIRTSALRDEMVSKITGSIPGVTLNGHPTSRLPGNAHLTFLGASGEDLIIKLDEHGIAASTGSACSMHTQKESHVLRAMGVSPDAIRGSLRLTLGPDNTAEDVGRVASALPGIVEELRAVSPLRQKYRF